MKTVDIRAALAADRKLIDKELDRILRFGREVPARLALAMRYAALGPGKRIRPVLALWSFRAAGGRDDAQVLPFCSGIEMIHSFSLVHDDLPSMDNDDFRRGRPSLHRRFDEGTAILAADGLLAFAFETFAESPAPAARKIRAVAIISRAIGPAGMTGGQALDIAADAGASARRLAELQRKKTADFIAATMAAGAAVAGAGIRKQESLWAAGVELGMLFQITDDLLDARQQSDDGRLTMVGHYGVEGTRRRAEAAAERAETLLAGLGTGYRLLSELPRLLLERKS